MVSSLVDPVIAGLLELDVGAIPVRLSETMEVRDCAERLVLFVPIGAEVVEFW